eukprot:988547-Amphidinium_carterae.1
MATKESPILVEGRLIEPNKILEKAPNQQTQCAERSELKNAVGKLPNASQSQFTIDSTKSCSIVWADSSH